MFSCALFLGIGPLYAIPIAGVAAALISIPVAFLVFMLKGPYFAIGTWSSPRSSGLPPRKCPRSAAVQV